MIYFYLGVLAAIFSLLGFYFRAFYFGISEDPKARQKIESLQKELREKQAEVREAREKLTKTSTVVRSLEQQVKQRNEEMEKLRKMASRQDEEIASLQKEAATIRTALAAAKKSPDAQAKPESAAPADRGEAPARTTSVPATQQKAVVRVEEDKVQQKQPAPKKTQQKDSAAPAWREDLNNIEDILDAMEKEIGK